MIKAISHMKDGRPLLLLGLSAANVDRMMANEPVSVDVGKLPGMPAMELVIFYGKTEREIADQLRTAGLVNDDTVELGDT